MPSRLGTVVLIVGLAALVGCQSTEVDDERLVEVDARLAEIDQRAEALEQVAAEATGLATSSGRGRRC